jgi:hypothetical protein
LKNKCKIKKWITEKYAILQSLDDGSMCIDSQHFNGNTVTLIFKHVTEPAEKSTQCAVAANNTPWSLADAIADFMTANNTPKSLTDAIADFIGKPLYLGSTKLIQFMFEGDVMTVTIKVTPEQQILFSKHDTVDGTPRSRSFSLELDLERHHAHITEYVWDPATRRWVRSLNKEGG